MAAPKKMLIAWGAQNASALVSLMKRSGTGWQVIIMDGPTGLSPALVAAVKQAYPDIKVLTSISVANGVIKTGHTDYTLGSPTYWGAYIVSVYKQYKSVGYDGVLLDDFYPPFAPSLPLVGDFLALSNYLHQQLPNEILLIPEWNNLAARSPSECWLFVHGFGNTGYTFQEATLDQIAAAEAAGWTVIAGSGDDAPDPDSPENCAFHTALFYCCLNKNNAFLNYNATYISPSLGWQPVMDLDIGDPTGPYTQAGSILTRNFTNGTVTVDLTARTGTVTQKAVTVGGLATFFRAYISSWGAWATSFVDSWEKQQRQ